MVNGYVDPREWTIFPPKSEADRLERYKEHRALLMGDHRDVFCHNALRLHKSSSELSKVLNAAYDAKEREDVIYVSSNYCKVASQLFANMLFGTPPKINIESDQDERQKRIARIIENNMLDVVNHQQAVETSSLGDAFYRVRWGRMANWREAGVILEALPAPSVYPILGAGNVKDNQGYCVTNILEDGDGKTYLYKEIHVPNRIEYQLFELDGESIGAQVPLDTLPTYAGLLAEGGDNWDRDGETLRHHTNYPGLFVEHVPNWTKPELFFGISDYTPDVVSNQATINEMRTGILRTCLKHMDPILAVPGDLFQYDERTGQYYAKKEDLQAIGLDPEINSNLPRYITWDAKLDAATTNIEACFEAMMLSLGISPAIFGMGKYGLADSGTALKLRMTQTLWLVGQKRMYFDAALKNILYAAQFLDGQYGPGGTYAPAEVSITWPDPLPQDIEAQAEALSKMVASGLYARQTAVEQVQSLEGDALDAEMDRIASDRRGLWLTTEAIPLLTSGAIDAQELLRLYNGISARDTDAKAADTPMPMPEEE